MHLLRSW